jgi:flagellar FliL protein
MAEQETEAEITPSGGGMMKKIVFALVGVVLLGVGAFVGLKFTSSEPVEGDEQAEAEPAKGPAIYQSLHPPLVVNLKDELGASHFMQITMEVMSRDQGAINAIRDHTPVIRNNLILLFGTASYEAVITREGKEQMLADGLAEIQRIMTDVYGEPGAEALYFTALVVQ